MTQHDSTNMLMLIMVVFSSNDPGCIWSHYGPWLPIFTEDTVEDSDGEQQLPPTRWSPQQQNQLVSNLKGLSLMIPIGSMYAIYGNIYHQYTPNVSIYTIHGSYGILQQKNMNNPRQMLPRPYLKVILKALCDRWNMQDHASKVSMAGFVPSLSSLNDLTNLRPKKCF